MIGLCEGVLEGLGVGHLRVYRLTGLLVGEANEGVAVGSTGSSTEVLTGFSVFGFTVGETEVLELEVEVEEVVGFTLIEKDRGVGLRVGEMTGMEVGE